MRYNINNKFVTIGDRRKTLSEWCLEFGISKQLVNWRVRHGYDMETAIIKPVRGWRHKAAQQHEMEAKDGLSARTA